MGERMSTLKTSEQIDKLALALSKAQGSMKAAAKSSTNPHFKSKYADLASIIDACREPMSVNGIAYTQQLESAPGGITITTMFLHSSGQFISSESWWPVPSSATIQQYGSICTYGRRYSLQSGLGLPADDDDGNEASGVNAPNNKPEQPKASAKPAEQEVNPHWVKALDDAEKYGLTERQVGEDCKKLLGKTSRSQIVESDLISLNAAWKVRSVFKAPQREPGED